MVLIALCVVAILVATYFVVGKKEYVGSLPNGDFTVVVDNVCLGVKDTGVFYTHPLLPIPTSWTFADNQIFKMSNNERKYMSVKRGKLVWVVDSPSLWSFDDGKLMSNNYYLLNDNGIVSLSQTTFTKWVLYDLTKEEDRAKLFPATQPTQPAELNETEYQQLIDEINATPQVVNLVSVTETATAPVDLGQICTDSANSICLDDINDRATVYNSGKTVKWLYDDQKKTICSQNNKCLGVVNNEVRFTGGQWTITEGVVDIDNRNRTMNNLICSGDLCLEFKGSAPGDFVDVYPNDYYINKRWSLIKST